MLWESLSGVRSRIARMQDSPPIWAGWLDTCAAHVAHQAHMSSALCPPSAQRTMHQHAHTSLQSTVLGCVACVHLFGFVPDRRAAA